MYTCRNGSPHQHALAVEGRICYGLIKGAAEPPPAYLGPWCTPRQMRYIEDLGGDCVHAAKLSKAEASKYIDRLKKEAPGMTTEATPPVKTKRDQQLDMLAVLLRDIPEGYFATEIEDGAYVNFLRISHPKRGKFAGSIKVQTQHGPRLDTDAALWSSGKWSIWDSRVIDMLMLLVVDYQGCALRYARKINKCCRCNSPLTDPRSRHYGIGPDCEEHFPWIIERVDEMSAG